MDLDSNDPIPALFPSIAAAAAGLGFPVGLLRHAKKKGCPAFEASGRVRTRKVLAWIAGADLEDEDSKLPALERLNGFKAEREKIKLRKDMEQVLDKLDASFAINKAMSILVALMDRKFKVEAPPALKGRDEASISSWLDQATQAFHTALRVELEPLARNGDPAA